MPVIETQQLIKNYRRIQALKGVSIEVEKGEIYGLLGQNGAGKTTLIKVLLGITRGWEGEAKLLGQQAGRPEVRSRIGYLPEDHQFPDYHTGYSLLDFYCQLLGVSRGDRQKRIPEMLDKVGLMGRMHYKLRTYSKGMKQRVGIAQAMVHNPEVIFLDEPTDGVDPIGRREIREIMMRLKDQGVTIFLNSHLLGEVEQICDRVAILQKGQVIREGSIAELTRQRGLFQVGLAPDQQLPKEELAKIGFDAQFRGEFWEIGLTDGQSIDSVVDLLRGRGLSVRHLVEKRQTLEELFMKTVDAAEPGVDRRAIRNAGEPGAPSQAIRK
ncbi:MAG TPA: ABC transporter ATP-binding protein [Gemmataceae bacterium]|nr:ABC transporter ATP-binding protein [Gemmataceae bacterium]